MRSVLVVSTVEHAEAALRAQVGDADRIKVVVPVVRQDVLDWLANDPRAFSHAEEVAQRTAEQLLGETVEAVAITSTVAGRSSTTARPTVVATELPTGARRIGRWIRARGSGEAA